MRLLKRQNQDLRGTWPEALGSLSLSILVILLIRWSLFEPYVIPSGSMIPTLLIHDNILVNKFAYSLRVPFTNRPIFSWAEPSRGDVIVFKSVDEEGIFLVKRVIGLPGDEVRLGDGGRLFINDKEVPTTEMSAIEIQDLLKGWVPYAREALINNDVFYTENLDGKSHVRLQSKEEREGEPRGPFKVPLGQLFMMGDNRDNSSDSRVWGTLPLTSVLGRASIIWLSCEDTLPESRQLCDPKTIRWNRIFKRI
jgi:signal peptidase I